jgi:GH15 family glucan-1,4-alpha-glucosidase
MLQSHRDSSYSPIEHYAVIGDCHCAALVSKRGSIDWLCLPRFDSPAVFSALLDSRIGGQFRVCPAEEFRAEQRYVDETNVLETMFETNHGRLRLTDLMPVAGAEERARKLLPERHILRVIECLDGEAVVEVDLTPRLEYGRIVPRLENRGRMGLFCEHRGRVLNLRSELTLDLSEEACSAKGRLRLRRGDRHRFSLAFTQGEPAVIPPLGEEADLRVEETIKWWRAWASRCSYRGPYRYAVLRSALALKLMTYAPSGAVVAAPTTSLPEHIGGVRNWDYRYCWLRDASMTLHALYRIGYTEEAQAFLSWLIHTTRLTRPELQVVYDVYGETRLKERDLDHLEGYANSRPVRIGNEASDQLQLDIYGEVADGVFAFLKWGKGVDRTTANLLRGFGETVCRRWREPDEGIWEVRSKPKHYTFSKVMCWVALDRLIKMHEARHIRVEVEKLMKERDAIESEIETRGFNEKIQSYTIDFESEDVDVSLLLLPIFGYIGADHPRMRSTLTRIQEQLGVSGLLYRYPFHFDGLPPGEGAFAIAGFWAVECLALQGEYTQASQSFERLLSLANHAGLYAEEIDPKTGSALGNFPQAYTHVGLINAALALAEFEEDS